MDRATRRSTNGATGTAADGLTGQWPDRAEGRSEDRVLAHLAAATGDFVSGENMAAVLGVSRNAIWKMVTALRRRGYGIAAVPRRGYRLEAVPDIPFAGEVQRDLVAEIPFTIEYVTETSSTNDLIRQRAQAGAPEGLVIVAETQTDGRGRRGRGWSSPPGVGLWVSVLLRPPLQPREVLPLGLLLAAAARAAIAEQTGLPIAIKWPNDLVVAAQAPNAAVKIDSPNDAACGTPINLPALKLGGVLVEMAAEADSVHHVVAGIAMNVNQTPADFPPDLADQAASLRTAAGRRIPRVPLLRAFLTELAWRYKAALAEGFGPVLAEVSRHCITLDRPVTVFNDGGDAWTGRALALTADGALTVRPTGATEIRIVYAGDVSIRHKMEGEHECPA